MDRVIPILPCPDIRAQVEFYRQLGFTADRIYISPNPYAVLHLGGIEFHFYGSKKMKPEENPSMCYISVSDVDSLYNSLIQNIKAATAKIPRTGRPRISKIRDLKDDRRFTLTDTGGNTFYIGSPSDSSFFRTLRNAENKKDFAVLYDLQYSKEDSVVAANMLPRLLAVKNTLDELDKAKLLLVALDIWKDLGQSSDDAELIALIEKNSGDEWKRIKARYQKRTEE